MKRLDPEVRRAIERRTEYLRRMPRMYALTPEPRYPGCRSFAADDFCRVYYMVAAGGNDCYITAIEEEEPEEGSGLTGGAGAEQEL